MPEVKQPAEIRPGKQTSEFLVTAIVAVPGVLAAAGIIGQSDAQTLTSEIHAIVGGIVALIAVLNYVIARTALKLRKE